MATDNEIRIALQRADFSLDVDVELPDQGITAVFGTSGSGKTSLLRCVAGLERAAIGLVRMGGQTWQNETEFLPTWRRSLGYVFQESSLLAHLTVASQLKFGLKRTKNPQATQDMQESIALLGIAHLMDRRTTDLSGGERQRVAIACALALKPRVLLLDEPLAALDLARRQEVMPWLERLRDQVRIPMLYVTHSVDEVARLADHLVLLGNGRVLDSGAVAEVIGRSAALMASADELGVLLHAKIEEIDRQWHLIRVAFKGGSLWVKDQALPLGASVRIRVLARDISLAAGAAGAAAQSSIQNFLPVTVQAILEDQHPSQVLVRLACGESLLWARITARAAHGLDLRPGLALWAQVKSAALVGA